MADKPTVIVELDRALVADLERTFPSELQGGRKGAIRVARALRCYLRHPEIHEVKEADTAAPGEAA